jgi:transposase
MPQPIDEDVRARVIEAVAAGVSARKAARTFGVSVSSAIKWVQRWQRSGSYAATPVPHPARSPLRHKAEFLLALVREKPGLTLAQAQLALHQHGLTVALSTVWRFYHRHGIRLHRHRAVTDALAAAQNASAAQNAATVQPPPLAFTSLQNFPASPLPENPPVRSR